MVLLAELSYGYIIAEAALHYFIAIVDIKYNLDLKWVWLC